MRPLVETGEVYRPNQDISDSVYYKNIIKLSGEGKEFTFLDDDLMTNPDMEKSVCSGDIITPGGAIIGTLSFSVIDYEADYVEVKFQGMEVDYKVELYDKESDEKIGTINMFKGTVVDESDTESTVIDIECYDELFKFDVEIDKEEITFPITNKDFFEMVRNKFGINVTEHTNGVPITDTIGKIQDVHIPPKTTYRQFFLWFAERNGRYCICEYDEILFFYDSSPRYITYTLVDPISFTVGRLDTCYTKAVIRSYTFDDDNSEIILEKVPNVSYPYCDGTIEISGNPLITKNEIEEAKSHFDPIGYFNLSNYIGETRKYVKYGEADIPSDPRLRCPDAIAFNYLYNEEDRVAIFRTTSITTIVGEKTKIKSAGKSTSLKGRATYDKGYAEKTEIKTEIRNNEAEIKKNEAEVEELKSTVNKSKMLCGTTTLDVAKESITTRDITFKEAFDKNPVVVCQVAHSATGASGINGMNWQTNNITKTGFRLKVANGTTIARNNVVVHWIAMVQ